MWLDLEVDLVLVKKDKKHHRSGKFQVKYHKAIKMIKASITLRSPIDRGLEVWGG